jgi:DNA repair exonuclease SbcCD nuclease subunit
MSKMTLGFFTDTHARISTPCGRTDDYRQALLSKLEEIGGIWKENGVDLVAFGGDLFHTPDPPNSIMFEVMQRLKAWKLPIVGIIGSHDYFGFQLATLERTAVGLFHGAGVLELIGDGLPNTSYQCENCVLTATPHTFWLADDPYNFYIERVAEENQLQVQLVHGDLINHPVLWKHVTVEQMKTESDLVLSGHYHPGWEKPIKIGNTTFVNPGSIGRLENGKQRTPRVCIVDISDRQTWELKYVPLENAQPHPFFEKESAHEENTMQDLTKLFSIINETAVDQVDLKSQIPAVAKELHMSDIVVEKAFSLIESAST